MKKILDWVSEAFNSSSILKNKSEVHLYPLQLFIWIYEIVLYSVIVPTCLGIIWLFSDTYIMLFRKVYTWYGGIPLTIRLLILIFIGICLKILRNNYSRNNRKTN